MKELLTGKLGKLVRCAVANFALAMGLIVGADYVAVVRNEGTVE